MSDIDDYLRSLPEGAVVHVARTSNAARACFERCAVRHGADGPELWSVALVGDWPAYALPHRTDSGSIDLGTNAATGTPRTTPAQRALAGSRLTGLPGRSRLYDSERRHGDIAVWPALALTVAPMSADERVKAWERYLYYHIQWLLRTVFDAGELLDKTASVLAARERPFPDGEPTLAQPTYPGLWDRSAP